MIDKDEVRRIYSLAKLNIDDKDLEWEAKTSRGPGGQHVNKIQTAVRLTHLPTGCGL